MSFQFTRQELTLNDRDEAEKIAKMLFGVYDFQGTRQSVYGHPGMADFINRSVIRKIRPSGSCWKVGEDQESVDGFPALDENGLFVKSRYYIKKF